MHTYQPYVDIRREDDHFLFGPSMSHPIQQSYDSNWQNVDNTLYNLPYDYQQKYLSHDYVPFQQVPAPYHASPSHISESYGHIRHIPGYNHPMDTVGNLRYNSPSGHFGGSVSESSSDYNISPEVTRQQTTFTPHRYLSPSAESQFSQQTWSVAGSFMITPTSTPASTQTPSIALKELEYQGRPEFQLDVPEDDIRAQGPVNVPEELDLSESIATLTTSSQANTSLSTRSPYDTDSSVSTPVRDNDSDSDFDPKRRSSKSSAARQLAVRLPRRTSSSSYTTLDANCRIHKPANPRSNMNKEKSKPRALPQLNATSGSNSISKAPKSFPCTFHAFGCRSTFANKNEWKRHVTSQHLQLGFYRCDLGTCNPDNSVPAQVYQSEGAAAGSRGRGHNKRRSVSNCHTPDSDEEVKVFNDFNRKDLFTQHCRRMHGPSRHLQDSTTQTNQAINTRLRLQGRKLPAAGKPMCTKDDEAAFEEELEQIRQRCWTLRRHAPTRSSCGFCHKIFEARNHMSSSPETAGKAEERAWEERMEHLGRHFERDAASANSEAVDRDLLAWGLREGILIEVPGVGVGAWLDGYEVPEEGKEEEEEERREGLRRRGPRRKVSVAATAKPVSSDISHCGTRHIKDEDSDVDAMAEDD